MYIYNHNYATISFLLLQRAKRMQVGTERNYSVKKTKNNNINKDGGLELVASY